MQVYELLEEIRKSLLPDGMKLNPPASEEEIDEAESKLNIKFPDELKKVLKFSNGAMELMIVAQVEEYIELDIYWSVKTIVSASLDHIRYREGIESKHKFKYLCIADNGCGENFGYKIVDGKCIDTTIYIYYPIEDRYEEIAKNFEDWAIGWFSGKIKG